jgi:hypothetical protein
MGGVVSTQLLWLAVGADVFLPCVLFLALSFNPSQVYSSGFFIFGADLVANLISFLQALAGPLISFALAGLLLKGCTYNRRVPDAVHILYAIEPIMAAVIGLVSIFTLFVCILDLAIWILIYVAVITVCIGFFAALIGGLARR